MARQEGKSQSPYAKYSKKEFIYSEVDEISRARRAGDEKRADQLADAHTAKHLRSRGATTGRHQGRGGVGHNIEEF